MVVTHKFYEIECPIPKYTFSEIDPVILVMILDAFNLLSRICCYRPLTINVVPQLKNIVNPVHIRMF